MTNEVSTNVAVQSENGLERRPQSLRGLLETPAVRNRFDEVLGKKAAGFISSIISATSMNAQLSKADPMSIMQAAMIAASLDLPINPSLGFAYIVPYNGQAQFQMGYKGYIQLAMRSGKYKLMNVTSVCEGQIKTINNFTGEVEFDMYKPSGKVVGYVAYFKLLNGFEKYLYMTVEDLERHAKKYSQTYKKNVGKWKDDFNAMAQKTVIKQLLSKWGLLSIELQKAIETDQSVVNSDGTLAYVDNDNKSSAETQTYEGLIVQVDVLRAGQLIRLSLTTEEGLVITANGVDFCQDVQMAYDNRCAVSIEYKTSARGSEVTNIVVHPKPQRTLVDPRLVEVEVVETEPVPPPVAPVELVRKKATPKKAAEPKPIEATPESLMEVKTKLLESFSKFGVTQGDIEAYVSVDLESMSEVDITTLREVYKDILHGDHDPAYYFSTPEDSKPENLFVWGYR